MCMHACRSEISQGQGEANKQTAEASKFPSRNPEISLTPDCGCRIQGWKGDQGYGLINEDLFIVAQLHWSIAGGVSCWYLDFNIWNTHYLCFVSIQRHESGTGTLKDGQNSPTDRASEWTCASERRTNFRNGDEIDRNVERTWERKNRPVYCSSAGTKWKASKPYSDHKVSTASIVQLLSVRTPASPWPRKPSQALMFSPKPYWEDIEAQNLWRRR